MAVPVNVPIAIDIRNIKSLLYILCLVSGIRKAPVKLVITIEVAAKKLINHAGNKKA
jgi:hypothetical protein